MKVPTMSAKFLRKASAKTEYKQMYIHFKDGSQPPIPWNYNEPAPAAKAAKAVAVKTLTPAEEIFESVKEFYRLKGQPVPPSDIEDCLYFIKEEANPKPPETFAPSKPTYGSPEFWKAHWEKKKAAGWVPKNQSKKTEP
jgi:hypothetical protein